MAAGNVLVAMVVCLGLWAFLYGPALRRAAEASEDGTRRTVALAILRPVTAISNALAVTRLTDAVERGLGRDPAEAPGGEIVIPPDQIPSFPGGEHDHAPGEPHERGDIRTPTTENKLRVVVVGDSLAAGLGTYLQRVFSPSLVRISPQGRISTGLARPDYFDWAASLQLIVDRFRPDLVIVMMGENDNQPLRAPDGDIETPIGTYRWPQAYEERVADLMDTGTSRGARLVWVGLPVVRDEDRWPVIQRQNDIFERAANGEDDVAFVDAWGQFSTPSGGYTAYYRDGDTVRLIRESDGVHFNVTGYELLARLVADTAEQRFGLSEDVVKD
jgi:hypothetical protein